MRTTQIIQKDLLRINQSKIKRLTRTTLCPQRYYLEEISGDLKRKSSEAMDRGHYLEYKIWGTLPKEGNIPILKGGRAKGSISEPQKRIDQQAADFPKWMDHYGIKVAKTDYKVEVMFNNDIVFFGTCDALVQYKNRPYIFDLKLTADVTSTFGDFAWGNFKTFQHPVTIPMKPDHRGVYTHVQTVEDGGKEMDLLQAHSYMYIMEKFTGKRWGFLYGVFDYKAKGPDHKLIEVPYDFEEQEDLSSRMLGTSHKLNLFEEMDYAAIPSESECKICKAVGCLKRMTFDVLVIEEPLLLTSSVQTPRIEDLVETW
jgi:hypothetical protein